MNSYITTDVERERWHEGETKVITWTEGWHFSAGREKYGAKRPLSAGRSYSVTGKVVMGRHGMHASQDALDALKYASGSMVSRVRLSGDDIVYNSNTAVAATRTHLLMADATDLLHEFACWCEEQALVAERQAGLEPDPRQWAAVETKRHWLKYEISNGQLAAASNAARSAAMSAARIGGWSAAWSPEWSAARSAQNLELEKQVRKLLGM